MTLRGRPAAWLAACWLVGCASDPTPLLLLDRGAKGPERVVRDLESQPFRSYQDTMDLGTARGWLGAWAGAAEAYDVAARQADTTDQLAAALYAKAGTAGYAGDVPAALEAAELVVRLRPTSREAAQLRFALATHHGDPLAWAPARDHLRRLDPKAAAGPEPRPVAVVGPSPVVGFTVDLTASPLPPPATPADVVEPLFRGLAEVGGDAARPHAGPVSPGPALGGGLLGGAP